MKKLLFLSLFNLFFLTVTLNAQKNNFLNSSSHSLGIPMINFGAEIQYYPAGWIYSGRADLYWKKHNNANFRIGYNAADRKDFSSFNDNEKGGGFGASIGYRYYLGKRKGLFAGLRTDIWQLNIDWVDVDAFPSSGNTNITIFQPTLELGYQFILNKHWIFAPTFTNGREINIVTKGEEVAQGWITLIGLNVNYKLF